MVCHDMLAWMNLAKGEDKMLYPTTQREPSLQVAPEQVGSAALPDIHLPKHGKGDAYSKF